MTDFETVRKIGQGSYGEVFLVRLKKTNELFAMKKLLKRDMLKRRQVNHVWLERFVLATVGEHPHVVKMYFSFQDQDYLYLVMEYLPGGDLLNMLIRHNYLAENWARFYIAELIVAINALHRTGIIHRDIKPDNVLFSRAGHVCLSDFGLSKFVLGHLQSTPAGPANAPNFIERVRRGDFDLTLAERKAAWKAVARNRVFSAVGTPSYIAPEVLNDTSYTEACDWWSVGAILYEMLVGVPPFLSDTPAHTIEMIRNWREYLEFPDWPQSRFSHEARDLIGRLLCDASVRLGAREGLREFKAHPFFAGVDWDCLAQQKPPFIPDLKDDVDTRYFDDEIPDAPYDTSNINTSSNSSNDVTNTTGSNAGSHETAIANSTGAQSAAGSRKSSTNRKPTRGSRIRDLDFLGFTYMPVHSASDHRLSWQSESYRGKPSSAPPRSSAQRIPERIRSTSQLGTNQASPSADQALPHRSHSVGPSAQSNRATPQSRQRAPSGPRYAPPLPPYRRPSSDAGRNRNEEATSTEESVRGLVTSAVAETHLGASMQEGKSDLSNSRLTSNELCSENGNPVSEPSRTLVSRTAASVEDDIRQTTPVKPPQDISNVYSESSPHEVTRRRERPRNTEDDAELHAISETNSFPVMNTSDNPIVEPTGDDDDVADGSSDVGSTMTPDLKPLPEPEGVSLSTIGRPGAPTKQVSVGQVSTQGRAHKSSLVPDTEFNQESEVQPLDAHALEDQSIEVPSTSDVVNFVMDAVEELEDAAAELDVAQTGAGKDIDMVIRNAASDLNGTALELHRNLSESKST